MVSETLRLGIHHRVYQNTHRSDLKRSMDLNVEQRKCIRTYLLEQGNDPKESLKRMVVLAMGLGCMKNSYAHQSVLLELS